MTIHDDERRQRWARDGLFVVRRAFDDAWVRQLASACDHALGRVRATSKETGHTTTNISPLLHPECFADRLLARSLGAPCPPSFNQIRRWRSVPRSSRRCGWPWRRMGVRQGWRWRSGALGGRSIGVVPATKDDEET